MGVILKELGGEVKGAESSWVDGSQGQLKGFRVEAAAGSRGETRFGRVFSTVSVATRRLQ